MGFPRKPDDFGKSERSSVFTPSTRLRSVEDGSELLQGGVYREIREPKLLVGWFPDPAALIRNSAPENLFDEDILVSYVD